MITNPNYKHTQEEIEHLISQLPFYREVAKGWKERGNQVMVDNIADSFKRLKLAEKRMAQMDRDSKCAVG